MQTSLSSAAQIPPTHQKKLLAFRRFGQTAVAWSLTSLKNSIPRSVVDRCNCTQQTAQTLDAVITVLLHTISLPTEASKKNLRRDACRLNHALSAVTWRYQQLLYSSSKVSKGVCRDLLLLQ